MEVSEISPEIIDILPISISIHQEGKLVYANKKCCEIAGYPSPRHLIGKNFEAYIHPEDREKNPQKRDKIRIINKQGETRYLEISRMKAKWHGTPAIIQFSHDVTSQTKTQQALEETTNQLIALHKHITKTRNNYTIQEIAEKTLETLRKILNIQICSIALIEENQLVFKYQNTTSQITKISLDEASITTRAVKTGNTQNIPNINKDPDYVDWSENEMRSELVVPIKIEEEIIGVINCESPKINAFTVEDQKLVEIIARQFASDYNVIRYIDEIQQLERNRTKELLAGTSQVTKMVKHDLKGPLQIIKNTAYLLKTNNQEYANIISENVKRVNEIIEDLGNLTLTTDITLMPTDIISLIKDTVKQIIVPENIQISIDSSQEVYYMNIDRAKFRRAIRNLITNAIEASPKEGTIKTTIKTKDNNTIITIQDTGDGIPPETQHKIFTPLYTTKKKGRGLGLIIVKQIIEAHNGKISFRSTEGKGTTFKIALPITTAS